MANLTSPAGAAGDEFGRSAACAGARIVIGAPYNNDLVGTGIADQGAATVFSLQFGFRSFEQELLASTPATSDYFGFDVAMDADTIIVGAFLVNAGSTDSKAAYVFHDCGGPSPWTEQARVVPHDDHAGDEFAYRVGVSGTTMIAGAHGLNGTGTDVGAAYIHELSRGEFVSYGFGDGSSASCPCANESQVGIEQGCRNSTGRGGTLSARGSDSANPSDLVFVGWNLKPSAPALLYVGNAPIASGAGLPFGDGLRLAGGFTVRLQVAVPNLEGRANWGPFPSMWSAGDVRYFQAWYRDPTGGPCGSGFNLTNGLRVTFQ